MALAVIVLLAVGVRCGYLVSNPDPVYGIWIEGAMAHNALADGRWFQQNDRAYGLSFNSPDGAPFDLRERRLVDPADYDLKYADAHPVWEPVIIEPVGEAVVLAGLWTITGTERFLQVQILRILLDAAMVLLVYLIAMRLFDRRRAALFAAVLYAVFPPIAWQATYPTMDIWGVDFTIAVVALYLEALRGPSHWRWLIACGLVAGVGSYFRPFVLILLVALPLVTAARVGWGRSCRRVLAMCGIAGLLLIPWIVRNYEDFGAFIPTRTGFGATLWEGLGERPNGFGAVFDDFVTYDQVHRVKPNLRWGTPAYDHYLMGLAIPAIEHHPLFYLALLAARVSDATITSFDGRWEQGGFTTPSAYGHGILSYAVDHPVDLLELLLPGAVFVLGMLGLLLTWREQTASHAILLVTVVTVLVPYLFVLVLYRYILPATFVYLIWIALGLDRLLERLSELNRARPAIGGRVLAEPE